MMFNQIFRKLKRRRSSLKPCGQTLIFSVRWYFNRRRETVPLYQGFAQLLGEPLAVAGIAGLKTMMRGLLLGYRYVPAIGETGDRWLTRDEELILQIIHCWQRSQSAQAMRLTGQLIDPLMQPVFNKGAIALADLLQTRGHTLVLPWQSATEHSEYLQASVSNYDRSRPRISP